MPPPNAAPAMPLEKIGYGPWKGSKRSCSPFAVPREYAADPIPGTIVSHDFDHSPRTGFFNRRKGTSKVFDDSTVGLLPAKWGATYPGRCRQMEEFPGELTPDGVPTIMSLVTKERINTALYLDDGRFSTIYMRDQANDVNYTLGDEFGATTYPAPGTTQTYRYAPSWTSSGDGGIGRGVSEFQRRLMLGDPRGFLKVGRWFYTPGGPHGLPLRFEMVATPGAALVQTAHVGSDAGLAIGGSWGLQGGAATVTDAWATADGVKFVRFTGGLGGGGNYQGATLGTLTDPGIDTGFKLRFTCKSSSNANARINITLTNTAGGSVFSDRYIGLLDNTGQTVTPALGNMTGSFVQYEIALSDAECALVNFASTLIPQFGFSGLEGSSTVDFDEVEFITGSAAIAGSHLIPSGPIPPTHCGYIETGDPVAGTTGTTRVVPDGDISAGSWTNSDGGTALYSYLDEAATPTDPVDDGNFIIVAANSTCEVSLGNLGFTPADDDLVEYRWRALRFIVGGSGIDLTVSLRDASTEYATVEATLVNSFVYLKATLNATQVAAITTAGSWNDLRLRFVTTGRTGTEFVRVSWACLEHTEGGAVLNGGWRGSDRFPFAMAYEFEDGAVWAFTVARLPNATLTNGLGIHTVSLNNALTRYQKLTWHIPVPPKGVKYVRLLRGTKITVGEDDDVQMAVRDMRQVWKVDAGVTTYDDYGADDDTLIEDVDQLTIRKDHIMPPRSRWIFGGDSRICHSYGGLNPCAMTLSPVGFTADWDLNLPDTSSTAYSANASYYKLTSTSLVLVRDTGSATSTRTFLFSDYPTLEELCDAINATSTSDTNWSGGAGKASQWRAQVLHGEQAACATALCPTARSVASCVVSSQAITKAAGGLSDVPVGAFISEATAGAYVSKIVSDTELTYVGSGASSGTLTFVAGTGDSVTGATHTTYEGYVRVIANSLPGFLFFTTTYLDQFPIEKSAIWMTVGNPDGNKAAANCFSGGESNKFTPPHDVGVSMGGFSAGESFRTPFRKSRRGRITYNPEAGPALDRNYRIFAEPDGGCHGPAVQGPGCGVVWGPEGWYVCDAERDVLISGAIWNHSPALGDFAYEAPLCSAAAAADTDTAHLHAKVMRGALHVTYRTSGSLPNRRVKYDFAGDLDSNGIAALLRPDGSPYGWSTPHAQAFTEMCSVASTDGEHVYGWSEANAGSAGDGRLDEFEVGDTDNGTAIAGAVYTPWESAGSSDDISGQSVYFEHDSPTGSTGSRTFSRTLAVDTYTGTPGTNGSLPVTMEVWDLAFTGAKVASAACYIGYLQATGGARELRKLELRALSVPNKQPGQSG